MSGLSFDRIEAAALDIGTSAKLANRAAADIDVAAFHLKRARQAIDRLPPVFASLVVDCGGYDFIEKEVPEALDRLATLIDLAGENL